VKLTTHLRLVQRSKNVWSCTSTPPIRLHGVVLRGSTGTTFTFTLFTRHSAVSVFLLSSLHSRWLRLTRKQRIIKNGHSPPPLPPSSYIKLIILHFIFFSLPLSLRCVIVFTFRPFHYQVHIDQLSQSGSIGWKLCNPARLPGNWVSLCACAASTCSVCTACFHAQAIQDEEDFACNSSWHR
jgi:hypothetical protein